MPLKSKLHVPQLLNNVSVQYKNSEYIWDKVFPQVNVVKDTDLYLVYDRNFKIPETRRAPKGVSREWGFDVSTSSYLLEKHALKDYVGTDESENYDQGSLDVDTTENLTDAIYRRVEKSVADLFTTTSWSLNVSLASGAAFSDNTTTSDPVRIFDTASAVVIANGGVRPNFGILPYAGMLSCKNHVSILDRIKYTSSEITEAKLAALFNLPELLVPTAVYDTAAEGLAESISGFYGAMAFVGWKPSSPGLKTPSAGYVFMKNAPRVKTWIDNERDAKAIEVEVKYQPKVIASLCGYLIKGT